MSNESWNFETRQIHAGQTPDPATGARALPIYQTTSFVFPDAKVAAARFALQDLGPIYTRIGNPTQEVVENRIASLEGGVGALLVSSGQAAETLAILNIAEAGDHIVASPSLYGGTYNLLHYTLPKLGIETTFVTDPHDAQAWKDAIRPNTKLFFAETIPNPKSDILDIELVAGVAHEYGVPLVVDNTVATPVPDQPAEVGRRRRRALRHQVPGRPRLGDRRRDRRRRLVRLRCSTRSGSPTTTPPTRPTTASCSRGTWASAACSAINLSFILKARVQLLRDLGSSISPFNAFLIAQGIETLSLRVERHVENAEKVAAWLEAREDVRARALRRPGVEPVARGAAQVRPPRRGRGPRVRDRRRHRGRSGVRVGPGAALERRQHR